MGRVAKPLDVIIKFKLRVAFRRQRIEDQQPAFGLRDADHLLENRLRLGDVVKGMLATDQIEAGVGKGKGVCIAQGERDVGDLLLSLELARLAEHFRCQVDAQSETHTRRDRQNKCARPTGDVEHEFMSLGLDEFHFLGKNFE